MIITGMLAALLAGYLLGRAHKRPRKFGKPELTPYQRTALTGAPPEGYGPLIHEPGDVRPGWLEANEIVARHLPMGLSERKAGLVSSWHHPFHVREDHPRYSIS